MHIHKRGAGWVGADSSASGTTPLAPRHPLEAQCHCDHFDCSAFLWPTVPSYALQSGASLLYIYCALHNFCRKVVGTGLHEELLEDQEKIRSTECDVVLFGSISIAVVV